MGHRRTFQLQTSSIRTTKIGPKLKLIGNLLICSVQLRSSRIMWNETNPLKQWIRNREDDLLHHSLSHNKKQRNQSSLRHSLSQLCKERKLCDNRRVRCHNARLYRRSPFWKMMNFTLTKRWQNSFNSAIIDKVRINQTKKY